MNQAENQQGFFIPDKSQLKRSCQDRQQHQTTLGNSYGYLNKMAVNKKRLYIPINNLTISNLIVGQDDVCELDGESISEVIIVGRTTNIHLDTMKTIIEINDNTGTSKAIFMNKDQQTPNPALKDFKYKVFKDTKVIMSNYIKEIDQFDEITNHHLQQFYASQMRMNGMIKNLQVKQSFHSQEKSIKSEFDKNKKCYEIDSVCQDILTLLEEMQMTRKFMSKNDVLMMLGKRYQPIEIEHGIQRLIGTQKISITQNKEILTLI
ncbi:UNKNOWN [Stylonychia lemnae]|uniref:Uncharacterized protein n=1 Tax=Stylonychia lemnae TaxID=5949 RepID=A0A078AJG5_STYLE|nr:UNKNOWN [Stylonychia lemnae]|eukprot:CDW80918.1 UNKNOWN [Stylonychia lemnae]